MSFFSLGFPVFLGIVFIIYYLIPGKYRHVWLLAAGYFFYAGFGKEYLLVLLSVTAISYGIPIMIKKCNSKRMGTIMLWAGILLLTGILIFFKFADFWVRGFYGLFHPEGKAAADAMNILAPMGLSFFSLTAIGYMIDVYKEKIECEHRFFRYALFISFFPCVLSGPIERGGNLLKQIQEGTVFSYDKVKKGMLCILWGFFLKLLIANRIAVIVDSAFGSYGEQTGATLLFAVFLYGIQLYADFAGYSCIAIGIADTLGFTISENFRQPYFSSSIGEFWKRWHISLSGWLKDYIYIPLGGSRKGKIRQYFNLLATFLISGIWHGTGFSFIIWGLLHGIYQVMARLLGPARKKLTEKLRIKTGCFSFRFFQVMLTFLLVDFAWLFFRAASTKEALEILKIILTDFQLGNTLANRLYLAGYEFERFQILVAELLLLLAVDCIHEKNLRITHWLDRQNKAFRWGLYLLAVVVLLLGAIHDYGLQASSFIYTQF